MIRWLAGICFVGSFLAFTISTLGLFRLPDPYSRLHGVSVGDTLGIGLVGLGLVLLSPTAALRIKLLVVLILFWLINPVMSHMVAKGGLVRGVRPTQGTKVMRE
ncbi:MAG: cation:proton antiporter [Firmicutes bacterium]|nr:cation:proton antiporter [Bacillota bacterium]